MLSHQSAAMHWQLVAYYASLPHITTSRKGRRRPGIRHHTGSLPADEVTIRDGIPVTTVARTLLDLATCLDRHRLERAIAEAQFRRHADSPSLPVLLERYRGRRGIAGLRASLASNQADLGPTRSGLEETFLRFLDARRLERPELNAPLRLGDGFVVVDCLWRSQRIAVELDGRAAHLRAAPGSRTGCATGACWSPTGSRPGSPRGSSALTPTASRRTSERWGSATDPPEIETRSPRLSSIATPTEGAR